jgi:hypothetical protein
MVTSDQGMISPGDQVGGVTVLSGVVARALVSGETANAPVGTLN